jgi:starch synthase
MRILFVTSEIAPFAKAGGIGDVAAALPRALAARGHDVKVVAPLYARVRAHPAPREEVADHLSVTLGRHPVGFAIESTPLCGPAGEALAGPQVPVYFVRSASAYDRPQLYTQDGDEHQRFALLGHAALRLCQVLDWAPDIVHANDWHAGLVPLSLRTVFGADPRFAHTRSVLTIHNIGHQGTFPAATAGEVGLNGAVHHLHQDQLREGRLSFLLTGILYADAITTVSQTHAREIMTPGLGVGLDPFLRARSPVVFGVRNGIDTDAWDPARDPALPAPYDAADLTGKAACKQALCEGSGLPYDPDMPLLGVVSRLVWQKGFDLVEHVLPRWLSQRRFQLVVLGTGEPRFEAFFAHLAHHLPRQVAFHRTFSEPMAHLIEAGADLFLMPSRYEPCGLNQMYSLRYGTPPIVYKTGGLADTVTLWDPATQRGNGFVFDHFDDHGLNWALAHARDAFDSREADGGAAWRQLQRNGMSAELGWDGPVAAYESIYRAILGRPADPPLASAADGRPAQP